MQFRMIVGECMIGAARLTDGRLDSMITEG